MAIKQKWYTVDDDLEDWTGWKPEPPSEEYFLISGYSTKQDSIVLWWAKK